jgi:hypothetical protein
VTDVQELLSAVTTKVMTVDGLELPYRDVNGYTGEVRSQGTVFVSFETLYELADQDMWDSQFGKVLLLDYREGLALEAAGLAVRETKGGYHRSKLLKMFLEAYGEKQDHESAG